MRIPPPQGETPPPQKSEGRSQLSPFPPSEAERGGHRSKTSCSKPPPAVHPQTTAPDLEPPRPGCDGPLLPPSPPPTPEEPAGAQPHGGGSSCPSPTGNKAPLPPPYGAGSSLLGRERGRLPRVFGAGSQSPKKPVHPPTAPQNSERGWEQSRMGGTDPSPPVPITEVASVPWYPSLY